MSELPATTMSQAHADQSAGRGVMPRALQPYAGDLPSFEGGPPRVTSFLDGKGKLVARGTTAGDHHWMHISGVGAFRFPRRPGDVLSPDVQVVPDPEAPAGIVEDFYLRSVLPVALQAYGLEVLHGSGVHVAGSGVVALCGRAESGKSTLAFALARRGHRHVADDAVVVDPGSLRTLPLPTAARLRRQSADHFGAPSKKRVLVTLEGWDEGAARPLPLAAAMCLRRGAPQLEARRLNVREAFDALLAEAYAFTLHDVERKRGMMRAYMRLATALPVYELSFPDGLENLPGACDLIASAARGAG
jgi:hypothetical protein